MSESGGQAGGAGNPQADGLDEVVVIATDALLTEWQLPGLSSVAERDARAVLEALRDAGYAVVRADEPTVAEMACINAALDLLAVRTALRQVAQELNTTALDRDIVFLRSLSRRLHEASGPSVEVPA